MSAIKKVFKTITDHDIKYVDFRFTDFNGGWKHITVHVRMVKESTFSEGLNFDGSSIDGWCDINKSDMFYLPQAETAFIDPYMTQPTLVLICDIIDAETGKPYNRDPRTIAMKSEDYLKKTGIADGCLMGPELEFFVFDDMRYQTKPEAMGYAITSSAGAWSTGDELEEGNSGHVPQVKGGYFQLSPTDRFQNLRGEILETIEHLGIEPTLHHHEVGTAGQCEIGMDASSPTKKADQVQIAKYVTRNTANMHARTATFMPKPLYGDNGSGMHVHQSLSKKGKNIFAGKEYNGLSKEALWYIGGIIKHAKALNAFTNPSTNSYKRLVPGYEAPVILTYAGRNRSAAIRIPASGDNPAAKRIEVRFPDPTANPYLAFAAMLMAGLDGIKNKIDPGKAHEENLYEDSDMQLPEVCGSLDEALAALHEDRDFLKEGGVFDDDMIDAYINHKWNDVDRINQTPHPAEFEMYYSV